MRHKVVTHVGRIEQILPTLGRHFDLIFIDAQHDAASVERDTRLALACLAPGRVLAWHDYGEPAHPDVKAVVDRLAAEHGWRVENPADRLAVAHSAV